MPLWTGVALALSVGFTLVVGVFPGWLIDATKAAVTPKCPAEPTRPQPGPQVTSGAIPATGGVFPAPDHPGGRVSCR